MGLETDHANVV